MARIIHLKFSVLATIFLSACGADSAPDTPGNNTGVIPSNPFVNCGNFSNVPAVPVFLNEGALTVILGSSSAAGAGANGYTYSWAGLYTNYQQSNGNSTQNIARGGDTTYHALPTYCIVSEARPQPDFNHSLSRALELRPQLVIISYPSNDAALGWSADESVANLLLLRSKLFESGIASIVIGAQPRQLDSRRTEQLRNFNRSLRNFIDGCFVDVYDSLELAGKLNPAFDSGDGVHLNRNGHSLVFEKLSSVISSGRCIVMD